MPRLADTNGTAMPAPYWRSACGGYEVWHADCRRVLPILPGVDFIFTDPPYGHNNNNGDLIQHREKALGQPTRKPHADLISVRERALGTGPPGVARPIANDGVEANELVRWSFGEWNRLLMQGGCCCCCCCCGGGGPDPQFARWSLWLDEAVGFKHMVVWDKGPMGMGWHYRRSYETVLVGEKPGGKCRWYDESCAVENVIRPSSGIRKIIPQQSQHPTEKPPELAAHFIRLHTLEGHLVLDPFMGCGSTAVACVELGRRFIGVELDLEYCKVAVGKVQRALMDRGTVRKPELREMEDPQPLRSR